MTIAVDRDVKHFKPDEKQEKLSLDQTAMMAFIACVTCIKQLVTLFLQILRT